MAKNITLLGANYTAVPAVSLPKTGGGTALFFDLEEVFPVGSCWATEDSTANPATVLGFGTWRKISPVRATWDRLKASSTWADIKVDVGTVYVYKRIS